jgi:hypothetical protein
MGSAAIPLIFEDMTKGGRHWSTALRTITGETAFGPELSGKLAAQNEAWLRWGRDKGFIV